MTNAPLTREQAEKMRRPLLFAPICTVAKGEVTPPEQLDADLAKIQAAIAAGERLAEVAKRLRRLSELMMDLECCCHEDEQVITPADAAKPWREIREGLVAPLIDYAEMGQPISAEVAQPEGRLAEVVKMLEQLRDDLQEGQDVSPTSFRTALLARLESIVEDAKSGADE